MLLKPCSQVLILLIKEPKIVKEKPDYLKKSDYGKVPLYLSQVKQDIKEEYNLA